MNTLTELTILIFTIVLLPILVPLIFLIFVPETIGRKELVRTGRLFVVKTILAWLYQFVPKLAETRFSLDLSWFYPLYVYVLLTFGLIFYVRKLFGMTRVFWTFLIADILFLAPNFIWEYVLAFVKSRNEILHYDLMLGKFGSLMDYLLFLAPTLFTAIVYTVLLLSWKNQNQLQISREANKESL